MRKRRKNKKLLRKIKRNYWITLFAGITTAYFIWLTWDKLTEYFGNSNLVWFITGGLVLFFIFVGHFSFKKIAERFSG